MCLDVHAGPRAISARQATPLSCIIDVHFVALKYQGVNRIQLENSRLGETGMRRVSVKDSIIISQPDCTKLLGLYDCFTIEVFPSSHFIKPTQSKILTRGSGRPLGTAFKAEDGGGRGSFLP
jgi:hypothetical protein